MNAALHLRISTPASILVESDAVRLLRARDASGSFGILPGHTDMLTLLPASVVEWSEAGGERQYCAVRGGVLTVSKGRDVMIACRLAVRGTSLEDLADVVEQAHAAEREADRTARVKQVRFHAQAVRYLVQYLLPNAGKGIMPGLPEKDWP